MVENERIGSCRVVGEIGSGGMAVIYRAVQESLGRTVAIKALRRDVAGEEQFRTRFEREALSLGSLQHENIVHVHDLHRDADSLYIVMEHVEGVDLYDLLQRCPTLPVDVAAIVAMQAARALDHAHYRGIIHRDVKPANLMISTSGVVKLMDFGIARDEAFGDLTGRGTGLGTPSYMSPEQILGDLLDGRSDLFSLGVVLYQMVCGAKPFVADETSSVMHKIRLERPRPPRACNPLVPRELQAIILRCLEKRPDRRYDSMQGLVSALERFVARRCSMNYRRRVVAFLLAIGAVAEEAARPHMEQARERSLALPVRARLPRDLRRLLGLQAAAAAATALLIFLAGVGGDGAPPGGAGDPGSLVVIADPWAEVHVDGRLLETTPFHRPLLLAPGRHRVELRHPRFPTQTREISLPAGGSLTWRARLAEGR